MKHKIAIAQTGTVLFDNSATMAKLERYVANAAKKKAKLVVFPEAFIGGYPKGLDFGATLGIRTPKGRSTFQSYFDCAIPVPGAVTRALGALAKRHKIMIVTGTVERAGGTLYCAALYFAANGKLIHHHRKLMPTAVERVIWGHGDGSSLKVVDTPLGSMGTLICWENYMPMARMALYQQGMQLYCIPTVDDREVWIPTLRHIAREGRCFVVSACQYLTKKYYPKDMLKTARYLPDTPIRGGSCVIDPLGEIVAGPLYDREGLLYADIDMDDIARGKYDFDVAGHYARPDIFALKIKKFTA